MEVEKPIFTVCGTPTYVAPEILSEIGQNSAIFFLQCYHTQHLLVLCVFHRLWVGSWHVGCWRHHVHPFVWFSTVPISRSKSNRVVWVHQSWRVRVPVAVLGQHFARYHVNVLQQTHVIQWSSLVSYFPTFYIPALTCVRPCKYSSSVLPVSCALFCIAHYEWPSSFPHAISQ